MKPLILSFLRILASISTDPDQTVSTMQDVIMTGRKMTGAISVLHLFEKLYQIKVGTNKVEHIEETIRSKGRRTGRTRNTSIILSLLEIKLKDAKEESAITKVRFRN
jgi:hypothetical protein